MSLDDLEARVRALEELHGVTPPPAGGLWPGFGITEPLIDMAAAVGGSNGISGIQIFERFGVRYLAAVQDHKNLHRYGHSLYIFEDIGDDDWRLFGTLPVTGTQIADVEDITIDLADYMLELWINGTDNVARVSIPDVFDALSTPGAPVRVSEVVKVSGAPGNVESLARFGDAWWLIERRGAPADLNRPVKIGSVMATGSTRGQYRQANQLDPWPPGHTMVSGVGAADIFKHPADNFAWLAAFGVGGGDFPNWGLYLWSGDLPDSSGWRGGPDVFKTSAGRTSEGGCFDIRLNSVGYPRFVYHNAEGNPGVYGLLYRTSLHWSALA